MFTNYYNVLLKIEKTIFKKQTHIELVFQYLNQLILPFPKQKKDWLQKAE
jgi:hypothetical protein